MMFLVRYTANNSGGNDWLTVEDWYRLRDNGWKISGFDKRYEERGEYNYAEKTFDKVSDAFKEFQQLTKQDILAEGCNCCGPPHEFEWWEIDEKTHKKKRENNLFENTCSGFSCIAYMDEKDQKKNLGLELLAKAVKTGNDEIIKETATKVKDFLNEDNTK